jgi:hypothetical protein
MTASEPSKRMLAKIEGNLKALWKMIPASQNHIDMSKILNRSPDFLEERELASLGVYCLACIMYNRSVADSASQPDFNHHIGLGPLILAQVLRKSRWRV